MFILERFGVNSFRNLTLNTLSFHPVLNIVTGENGQGKTNLLEAIFFLSVNRSFRAATDRELTRWGSNFFLLEGLFFREESRQKVRVRYNPLTELKLEIDGAAMKRFEQMQLFPVISFGPEDLAIIREGPIVRRRFMDMEGSRLSKTYFYNLKNYMRVLRQRNALLRKAHYHPATVLNDLLAPWDEKLAYYGAAITTFRLRMVTALEKEAAKVYSEICASRESLALDYIKKRKDLLDGASLEEEYRAQLASLRELDLKKGATQTGPHLDELSVTINERDSRKFSSQGQKKTAALALKIGQVNLFIKEHKFSPIILLDDVLSELDGLRKSYLLDFLAKSGGQCFVSNTERMSDIKKLPGSSGYIFRVKGGVVEHEASWSNS